MRRFAAPQILVAILLAGSLSAMADPEAGSRGGPKPFRIVNQVVDLLDEPVLLESDTDHESWTSQPFDTSQFTVIGLRASGETEGGAILCATEWQFAPDDEFHPSALLAVVGTTGLQRPDANFSRHFGEVSGLRARIHCRASIFADFGIPDPQPVTGSLTDVKVLLRRD